MMDQTDFLSNIQNKDEFVQNVKDELGARAYNALQDMKKEMANDFLQQQERGED